MMFSLCASFLNITGGCEVRFFHINFQFFPVAVLKIKLFVVEIDPLP